MGLFQHVRYHPNNKNCIFRIKKVSFLTFFHHNHSISNEDEHLTFMFFTNKCQMMQKSTEAK